MSLSELHREILGPRLSVFGTESILAEAGDPRIYVAVSAHRFFLVTYKYSIITPSPPSGCLGGPSPRPRPFPQEVIVRQLSEITSCRSHERAGSHEVFFNFGKFHRRFLVSKHYWAQWEGLLRDLDASVGRSFKSQYSFEPRIYAPTRLASDAEASLQIRCPRCTQELLVDESGQVCPFCGSPLNYDLDATPDPNSDAVTPESTDAVTTDSPYDSSFYASIVVLGCMLSCCILFGIAFVQAALHR